MPIQRTLVKLVLGAAGAGAVAALYALLVERTRVQLDHFTIPVDKPGLPADGLTVLHLSDLHCRANSWVQTRKLARLRRLLADEPYDVLAITGDLIHDAQGLSTAVGFARSLRPRLGAFSCPGNHDYCQSSVWGILDQADLDRNGRSLVSRLATAGSRLWAFLRKLRRNERVHLPLQYHDVSEMHATLQTAGIQPLVNRALRLQVDGANLWVAGIDDLWEGHSDLAAATREVPAGALLVLLAHNPDVWLDPCSDRADLILAGHVHGGQVRLPLLGAIHTQGSHLSRRRPAGWFTRGASRMFVSRGLGESLPFRFGVRPQAALVRLVPNHRQPGPV